MEAFGHQGLYCFLEVNNKYCFKVLVVCKAQPHLASGYCILLTTFSIAVLQAVHFILAMSELLF